MKIKTEKGIFPLSELVKFQIDNKIVSINRKNGSKIIEIEGELASNTSYSSDIISEDQSKFLIENSEVILLFHNEKVVGLNLPDNITLKVLETEGVVKGQTAASSYKPAELENNIKTSVPQFISIGDRVVISTQDGSYLEKAKD